MNKTLIVLLAVCLVSASAFVKRDAPAASEKNVGSEVISKLKEIGDDIAKVFEPEKIKDGFNKMVDDISKTVQDFNKQQKAAGAA